MFLSCISSLENYVMNHMNKQNGFTSFLPTKSIPISNSQGVYQTFIAKQLFIFQKASISRTKNVKIIMYYVWKKWEKLFFGRKVTGTYLKAC